MPCYCFYFDPAEIQPVDGVVVCECGHTDDEHDADNDCQAEMEET